MRWKDKMVLVTGGAGFIGSHLVKKLLNLGSDLYIADNFSRGTRNNIAPFLDKIHLRIFILRVFFPKVWLNSIVGITVLSVIL